MATLHLRINCISHRPECYPPHLPKSSTNETVAVLTTGEMAQWLEREFTDRKVRGSDPISVSRIPLSRLGQPGSIRALVLPSICTTVRHRNHARVYQATVRAVLLYGCETWPVRAAELGRLQVFDNRCLRTIARVGWCRRIRNEAVRKRVLGCATGTSIEECVQHQKLRWLGHVLRMPNHRLPKRVLFSVPNSNP
ncbi:hypothetical protein CSKR_106262 [Clonorchis sinensis]|uniref:Endonuclease-reverse transcriptase n=1 Tax=Clonorchis sinensis TaxID=79923 RepID=A0A3R7FSK2_CLOSI|nr:hypothetical protein CSKR_106262 [Clonorchis sinensis]